MKWADQNLPQIVSVVIAVLLGGGSFGYYQLTGDGIIFVAGMIGALIWALIAESWNQELD